MKYVVQASRYFVFDNPADLVSAVYDLINDGNKVVVLDPEEGTEDDTSDKQ